MKTIHEMITSLAAESLAANHKLSKFLQAFGIDYFCWQRITNSGYWSLMSNNPDWLLYSAEQQFYLHDPSLMDPKLYHNALFFAPSFKNKVFQSTFIQQAAEKFNIYDGLIIINRTWYGCEWSFLASYGQKNNIYNCYLNYLSEIKQYIAYYKQCLNKTIAAMQDNFVDISAIKKQNFYANALQLPLEPASDNKKQCIETLKLTPREKDCLQLAMLGQTAKQIAKNLTISPRTVETHLENIRHRYQLKSKQEFQQQFYLP